MSTQLLTGLVAGLVTFALFSLGTSGRGEFGFLLQISSVPLFAAGLGFGWRSALSGAVIVAIGLLVQRGFPQALSFALIFGFPIVSLSAIARGRESQLPLSVAQAGRRLGWTLAAAALWAGLLGGFAASVFANSTAADQAELTRQITAQLKQSLGDTAVTGANAIPVEELIGFTFRHIGELIAAGALMLLLGNMALAAGLLRITGRARRPLTDVGRVDLPFAFLLVLLVALGATLLRGELGHFGRAISVTGICVLAITGLAIFHFILRGHRLRFPALVLAYLALLVLNVAAGGIFALLALAEPLLGLRPKPDPANP